MYDMELLPTKTQAELRDIAAAYNIPTNKAMKKADIMQLIQVVHNAMNAKPDQPKEKPVFVRHEATQEDIVAECQKYASKGMELKFIDDGMNWHIRCKGAEDTGTRFQPMRAIALKIKEIAKGARNPRGIKSQDGKMMITA